MQEVVKLPRRRDALRAQESIITNTELAREAAVAHLVLDNFDAPRLAEDGDVLSLAGRIAAMVAMMSDDGAEARQ